MAEDRTALLDVLRKGEAPPEDVVRSAVLVVVRELMEAEVSAQIGAERYEQMPEWVTQRNGYHTRPWDTRVGMLELAILKLRTGSYFPSWLEPGHRAERALEAVVAETHLREVSPRKVEALVQSLGIASLSKSEVSRLCKSLDEQVSAFRTRRLDAEYPYLWVDARYEHVREGGRVISMAVVSAHGVRADGVREVLGFDVGVSEDVVPRREFLQGLFALELWGVKLVTRDAYRGSKQVIVEVFVGAAWQRCRVHFVSNLEDQVPKTAQPLVAAAVRGTFQEGDRARAQGKARDVRTSLAGRFPKVVALLSTAEEKVKTFYDFPADHERQIYSTNPFEMAPSQSTISA